MLLSEAFPSLHAQAEKYIAQAINELRNRGIVVHETPQLTGNEYSRIWSGIEKLGHMMRLFII